MCDCSLPKKTQAMKELFQQLLLRITATPQKFIAPEKKLSQISDQFAHANALRHKEMKIIYKFKFFSQCGFKTTLQCTFNYSWVFCVISVICSVFSMNMTEFWYLSVENNQVC